MENRVADLEKELKAIKDKAAADKKKAEGAPTAVVGGMIQADWDMFHQSGGNKLQFDDIQDGCAFRRARILVKGTGFGIMDYQIEADFASFLGGMQYSKSQGGIAAPQYYQNIGSLPQTQFPNLASYIQQTAMKDVFIGLHELPVVGNFKIGHFKEPFGLEQLTSDRFITFMERSMGDEGCMVPGRSNGAMISNWTEDERGTWALGVFRTGMIDTPAIQQSDNGGTAVTARATYLPWYDEATEGRGLWHLGAAYSYRDVATLTGVYSTSSTSASAVPTIANPLTMSARAENYLGPKVVALSLPDVHDYNLFGAEMAFVYGPLSFQTEFMAAVLNRYYGTATVEGGYATVSYFLTGENRVYDRRAGVFTRVTPFENFFRVRGEDGCVHTGRGAWEVAYRYSWVDLNDPHATFPAGAIAGSTVPTEFAGGLAVDHTLGLNWYLNPYFRLMFNWVHSLDTPAAKASGGNNFYTGTGTSASAAMAGKTTSMDTFEMRASIDF